MNVHSKRQSRFPIVIGSREPGAGSREHFARNEASWRNSSGLSIIFVLSVKILKRKRKILELIGLYEIIGGATGLVLMFTGVMSLNKLSGLAVIFWLIVLLFYISSIYAGVILLKYHEKEILPSKIVQYLQIISFGSFGFFLTLSAGFSCYIGFDYTHELILRFFFDIIPSKTRIAYLADQTTFYFYINLIPLLILIFFDRYKPDRSHWQGG